MAITQVVVYIGGILVLVLFTVMMTRVPQQDQLRRGPATQIWAGVFALGVVAVLYKVVTGTQWNEAALAEPLATTAGIGARFMTSYLFPFEYASLVLLAAMIGAAILIRETRETPEEPAAAGAETAAHDEEVQS